jgi:ABC-type xylose transport system permease subunit
MRAAFVAGVMNNGMSIYGLGVDCRRVAKGVAPPAAVYIDVHRKNKG